MRELENNAVKRLACAYLVQVPPGDAQCEHNHHVHSPTFEYSLTRFVREFRVRNRPHSNTSDRTSHCDRRVKTHGQMATLTVLVASAMAGNAPSPLIQDPLFDSAHDGEFVWHEVSGDTVNECGSVARSAVYRCCSFRLWVSRHKLALASW
jgi:hypothetical protein